MDSSRDMIVKIRAAEVRRLDSLEQWPNNFDDDDRGVLLSDRIERYAKQFDLISPFDPECLRPAGYDLRVGYNYSILGIRKALNEGMELEIGPYQVAVIEILEILNLPKFLIGRWNIRVQHAYKGLLWVGGAQVDPGFRGRLCCPIYNLSTEPVRLRFKERLAMIDFVTSSRFRPGCKEFPWASRKMLVFDEYPFLNSGIEKQVGAFQKEIDKSREETGKAAAQVEQKTNRSLQDIQTRIDTFVVLTFAVVAILFGGLSVVATKSSDSSLVVASASLIGIATIALYFALKPYYMMEKMRKTGSERGEANTASAREFSSLLQIGWTEIVLAIVVVLLSLSADGWSVWRVQENVLKLQSAQSVRAQVTKDVEAEKAAREGALKEVETKYDAKIQALENQVETLRKLSKGK